MNDPDFNRRLMAAKAEMTAAGLGASSAYRPLLRLLSALGLRLRPPMYRSFAVNFLFQSLIFGITWGVLMYFWIWREQALPLIAAVLAGVLFGLFMALYARWQFRRKNLSRWTDL